jgi:hypothetical protein
MPVSQRTCALAVSALLPAVRIRMETLHATICLRTRPSD